MAMSETQLSGLKKNPALIRKDDLTRVFTALGLRPAAATEPGTVVYEMPIMAGWKARALATEFQVEGRTGYVVDFAAVKLPEGHRVGPVFRTPDANMLQLRGAWVMSQIFESVDDVTPFACPAEGCTGLVTWDGRFAGRVTKPGMTCAICGWNGHTGAFVPLREMK
jgi:hypothetical protein